MKIRDNPDVLYHWEQAKLNAQNWKFSPSGCSKQGIMSAIGKWKKTPLMNSIEVSKLHWNSSKEWSMNDILYRDEVVFNVSKKAGIDELVGYLFQASINGYSIRYVAKDPETGIYLQRTNTGDTNIDAEVLNALVEAVDRTELKDKSSHDD